MSSVSELTKLWEKKCQDDKDYAKATRTSCHGVTRNQANLGSMMPKKQEIPVEQFSSQYDIKQENYRISSKVRESNKQPEQNENMYEQPRQSYQSQVSQKIQYNPYNSVQSSSYRNPQNLGDIGNRNSKESVRLSGINYQHSKQEMEKFFQNNPRNEPAQEGNENRESYHQSPSYFLPPPPPPPSPSGLMLGRQSQNRSTRNSRV